jgi:protein gp37
MAARNLPEMRSPTTGEPFATTRVIGGAAWTGKVELIESKLEEPLHWKKPRRVFVNSMSDLFHESLPDWAIDRVFAVMALCPQHTFQVLTKRPKRMQEWFNGLKYDSSHSVDRCWTRIYREAGWIALNQSTKWRDWNRTLPAYDSHPSRSACWPLPNVWLGVSVEDQATADARIPLLLQTPAAFRFVSYEPALGPVDFWNLLHGCIDWLICGGESGPGARPFDLAWARSARDQCKAAGVPFFLKQLGAEPRFDRDESQIKLASKKGGDPSEWPADLQNCRAFPNCKSR